MKKALATLLILAPLAGQTQASTVIFGGDFALYKPGTGYTVTATLDAPGPFTSYAQGVGDGVSIAGTNNVTYGDGTSGSTADLPGWTVVPGKGNPDTGLNGVGGSEGVNIFAGWGGQQRIQSDSVGSVVLGEVYTITAQIDGAAGGPMDGDLAFDLVANGALIPTAPLPAFTATPGTFQTISRTYDAATLAAFDGQDLTIIIGVQDSNALGNRMIWDDVTFDVVPEPSAALLLGLGGLALIRRKRS